MSQNIKKIMKRIKSNRRMTTKDVIIAYYIATFHDNLSKHSLLMMEISSHCLSLCFFAPQTGKHGVYPVNSQTESITRVKCPELKFLININIFRALCRESRRRICTKDGYAASP